VVIVLGGGKGLEVGKIPFDFEDFLVRRLSLKLVYFANLFYFLAFL
jgi:hypothetical protein